MIVYVIFFIFGKESIHIEYKCGLQSNNCSLTFVTQPLLHSNVNCMSV